LREAGLTFAKIAERFNISLSTISRLLEIAREPLMPEAEKLSHDATLSPPTPKPVASAHDNYTARVAQLVREGLSASEAMDRVLEQEAS